MFHRSRLICTHNRPRFLHLHSLSFRVCPYYLWTLVRIWFFPYVNGTDSLSIVRFRHANENIERSPWDLSIAESFATRRGCTASDRSEVSDNERGVQPPNPRRDPLFEGRRWTLWAHRQGWWPCTTHKSALGLTCNDGDGSVKFSFLSGGSRRQCLPTRQIREALVDVTVTSIRTPEDVKRY